VGLPDPRIADEYDISLLLHPRRVSEREDILLRCADIEGPVVVLESSDEWLRYPPRDQQALDSVLMARRKLSAKERCNLLMDR
jgi:hypothetical protein